MRPVIVICIAFFCFACGPPDDDSGSQDTSSPNAVCGNGIVEQGEECDDGNIANGDGCESDCTSPVCLKGDVNPECDDDDACNGVETCDGAGGCDPGVALNCDDSDAATSDTCISATGCVHLAFTGMNSTALAGNATGGTPYEDVCPSGQVMVGFSGTTGDSFDQLQVVCGIPTIEANLTAAHSTGDTLPLRGTNETTPVSSACPANEMLVGFEGRGGGLVDQLALRCASFTAALVSDSYVLSAGTATAITPVGGTGGDPFSAIDCGTGEVAIGATIRAGGSIDAFGLICGVPAVTN